MKILPIKLCLLLLIVFGCAPTQDKTEITEKLERTYCHEISVFVDELEKKYGTAAKDSSWKQLEILRTQLIGSKIDDFEFVDVNGDSIKTKNFDTPLFFEATASWCKPCVASIPAINQLSETYKDSIKFILITHDTGERAKTFAANFNKNVIIIPSKNPVNPTDLVKIEAGGFKHLFPFPTTYFINKDKTIVDIKTGGSVSGTHIIENDTFIVSEKEAFESNLAMLSEGIEQIAK